MYKFKILFLLFLFFASCKKEEDNDSVPIPVELTSYPLAVGNSWKYHTIRAILDSSTITYTLSDSYWKVLSDTTIDGIPTSKISQFDSIYNGIPNLSYTYYSSMDSGFCVLEIEGISSYIFFKNETAPDETVTDASNDIPDYAIVLLKFPSVINDMWSSNEFGNSPSIKRKWLGYETVTTKAGIFNCVKLQRFTDFDDDGEQDPNSSTIFQYFSEKGLVRESYSTQVNFGGGQTDLLYRATDLVEVNF